MRTPCKTQPVGRPGSGAIDHAPIPGGCAPDRVIEAWPDDVPLVALTSGSVDGRRARWSIIAAPTESRTGYPEAVEAVSGTLGSDPDSDFPFTGGWIGWVGYEAGAVIEPAARFEGQKDERSGWSDACFLRCPGAYLHDALRNEWHVVGDPSALPSLDLHQPNAANRERRIGQLRSVTGEAAYQRDVARVVELIHAGDAFQVNLAHHLEAPFKGDARGLFLDAARRMGPWYGAYIERPDGKGAICSCSPELFLSVDWRTREVVTRPIKGTRPASSGDADLRESPKDAAELAMIVDLMRNDLGRVCEYGSVKVAEARAIERHARDEGVVHGVATVQGRLREGVNLKQLLDATFPPGSVTGAPKVRAMQIIDELEPLPRGPYCGAIGFVSDTGIAEFNVAIRTALVTGVRPDPDHQGVFDGTIAFPVGAGLVADSDPAQEWQETLDKAAAFLAAAADRQANSL